MRIGYANPYLWYTVIPSVKFKCIREESSERSAKLIRLDTGLPWMLSMAWPLMTCRTQTACEKKEIFNVNKWRNSCLVTVLTKYLHYFFAGYYPRYWSVMRCQVNVLLTRYHTYDRPIRNNLVSFVQLLKWLLMCFYYACFICWIGFCYSNQETYISVMVVCLFLYLILLVVDCTSPSNPSVVDCTSSSNPSVVDYFSG